MDEPWIGIAEAGRLFRSRRLSPVELILVLLERIGQLDQRCGAFLRLTPDEALEDARRAQGELAAGKVRGPLHGIPYALKDNIDVAGVPTTCNSRILQENIARRDAAVVARLREAGAVLIGKASLHEFAAGGAMFDLPWPAARNPWNLELHPGGSSSGCGAALAAGFVPAAVGTDTGGSVRHPATACGLVGMKPTFDLVEREGVFPLAPSLDHVGPMTRDVEDNALLLQAMCESPGNHFTRDLRLGVKGLRLGLVEHFHAEDAAAHPEQVRGLQSAARTLEALGAQIEPVRLSKLTAWNECGRLIQQYEEYRVHQHWLKTRPQDYSVHARARFAAGAAVSERDAEAARRERGRLREELSAVLRRYDALIMLSSLEFPCRADDQQAVARTYARHLRMPFNVTGTPALAVPTGFGSNGLPLGMQIAGAALAEAMLYRIAWAYTDATGWTRHHPRSECGK